MDLHARRVFAVVLAITSCLQPIVADMSSRCFQPNEGLSSGCSIPLFKKFPYKNAFTPPCQRHDICYGCAIEFGKNRLYCDNLFLKDMLNVCSRMAFWNRVGCRYFARHVYYPAVRVGGLLLFKKTPKAECNQSWVPSCFP